MKRERPLSEEELDSLFLSEMDLYHRASAYKCLRKAYAGKELVLIAMVSAVADLLFEKNGTKPTMGKVVATLARKT